MPHYARLSLPASWGTGFLLSFGQFLQFLQLWATHTYWSSLLDVFKISQACFKASVSYLMKSSSLPLSQKKLLSGRWGHSNSQIPTSPLFSSSSWVRWGRGEGKRQSSFLHDWVRVQCSLHRLLSVVFVPSLTHSNELLLSPPHGRILMLGFRGAHCGFFERLHGDLCPGGCLTWDFICLNFFWPASVSPQSMTFSQRRVLSWEHHKHGSSTATLCGVPPIHVDWQWCICHAKWQWSLLPLSVLPLSLHAGSIKCSESPTPYPISVREDHQTLSLIMEGKESDPDRRSEDLSHS